jgi:uncharacterized protein (TIGR04255 family)
MGKKLNHAPVYLAVAQARFNPVLMLESYIPNIQDFFRKQGYPGLETSVLTAINLNLGMPAAIQQPQVPASRINRYSFQNMSKTSEFVLDQMSITYRTTGYDVFEIFLSEFMKGLDAVHKIVELSSTERIGMRYLDAIFPKEGESMENYLDTSLLGLSGKLAENLVHSFSQTVVLMENVPIMARAIIQDGPLGIPPDLLPLTLIVPERFAKLTGRHAILDTDGSVTGHDVMDLDRVEAQLTDIHDKIAKAFRASITAKALEEWEQP